MDNKGSFDRYERNIEDVKSVIHHAKLDKNELLPNVQSLYYSDASEDFRLIELDNELLQKLNAGTELVFRGLKTDKAVLCSDNKTYDIKEAETSNSLLLVPNLKFPDDLKSANKSELNIAHKNILGVFRTYLELKPCKPRMKILSSLLEPSEYRGSEYESELRESKTILYSSENLLNLVQASNAELISTLEKLEAFKLEEKWRMLEFNYHFRILSYFLAVIDEQSWPVDKIPSSEVFELLKDLVPFEILKHVLHIYSFEAEPGNTELRRINADKVCRFLGFSLLKSTNRLGLDEFLAAWKECVPLDLVVDLKLLNGLMYISEKLGQKVIHFCSESEMPENVCERIQYLFSLKEKWTLDEIKPFIEQFASENSDENAILTKYARASKVNGVRVYCSRHGK